MDNVASVYRGGGKTLASADGHTAILPLTMAGDLTQAEANIDKVHEVVHAADGTGGFDALITGTASIQSDFSQTAESDLTRGEGIGVPIALVILLIVFGAVVAAGLPVVLSLVAITAAVALTALLGRTFDVSVFAINMISMMGLATGIDYSLFIISRYREERVLGRDKIDAITVTGGTASRAVLFSGLTVVLALAGLLLVPTNIFASLAIGAILVVSMSVLAALTLLPAVLSLLGDRIDSLKIPYLGRRLLEGRASGRTSWLARTAERAMRRPALALSAGVVVLLLAASPIVFMKTGVSGVSSFPDSFQSKRAFGVLDRQFSAGRVSPVQIVVDGPVSSPAVRSGISRLKNELATDKAFGPLQVQTAASGTLALLSVPVNGDSVGDLALAKVRDLRGTLVPQAFAGSGTSVYVTGQTAFNVDYIDIVNRYFPWVFALVLSLSFLLLLVAFRSDRHPRQGDRHEPAQRRRRLRPHHAGVAGGRGRRDPRLRAGPGRGAVGAAVPVRGTVRPVHGLPGVPAQPHQGGLGQDRRQHGLGHRGRGRHGRHHHRCGADHGRRVRRVRDRRPRDVPADGLRPRRRRAAGRHPDPHHHGACGDEAARPLELVPAELARVAAEPEHRGHAAGRTGARSREWAGRADAGRTGHQCHAGGGARGVGARGVGARGVRARRVAPAWSSSRRSQKAPPFHEQPSGKLLATTVRSTHDPSAREESHGASDDSCNDHGPADTTENAMTGVLDLAAVDAVFAELWETSPAPGLAYGVVAGGRLVHFGGLGGLTVGGPTPTPDSVFRIASMTKSFTAAALLALRDDGLLRLDDPAASYVPVLATLRGPTSDSRPITLRDLATMSAGFPTDDAWGDRQLPLPPAEFEGVLARGLSFAYPPGTAFEYSNLGYAILGQAMATAAGSDHRAIVTSRILRPLGMTASVFEAHEVDRRHLAPGHRPGYAPQETEAGASWVQLPFAGHGAFAAMGGLYSSVSDLARWIGELTDAFPARDDDEAGHPLCRASRREMQQVHRAIPDSPGDDACQGLLCGGYGMGLAVTHDPHRGALVGHPGGLPGFGSAMRWHPETGVGVVALANSTYAPASGPVIDALDALVAARPQGPVTALWPETLAAQGDVVRLLQSWDDELASRVFAANVDMDEPLERRRAAATLLRERLGDLHLDVSTPPESSSPAQLTWWMAGPRGRVRVAISLSPESPPAVQTLELTPPR